LKERELEIIGEMAHSWLGVPLMVGDRVLGVMAVQSHAASRVYDEHDRDLLTALASQAAIALHNAHLFEQLRGRAEQEHLVRAITDKIRKASDTRGIMHVTLEELGQMLGASKSAVRLGTRQQLLSAQGALVNETKEGN